MSVISLSGEELITETCHILELENFNLKKGLFSQLEIIRMKKATAIAALEKWTEQADNQLNDNITTGLKRIQVLSNRNKQLLLATRNSVKAAEDSLFALQNFSSDIGTYNRRGKTVRVNSSVNQTKFL